MGKERQFDERSVERLIPWFRVLIAVIALLGLFAASMTDSGHWIERSGKVMVAASLLLTFLQFHYENAFAARSRLMKGLAERLVGEKGIPEDEAAVIVGRAVAEVQERFEFMRRRVLLHALATAGIGELIAAFGDVVYTAARLTLCR